MLSDLNCYVAETHKELPLVHFQISAPTLQWREISACHPSTKVFPVDISTTSSMLCMLMLHFMVTTKTSSSFPNLQVGKAKKRQFDSKHNMLIVEHPRSEFLALMHLAKPADHGVLCSILYFVFLFSESKNQNVLHLVSVWLLWEPLALESLIV